MDVLRDGLARRFSWLRVGKGLVVVFCAVVVLFLAGPLIAPTMFGWSADPDPNKRGCVGANCGNQIDSRRLDPRPLAATVDWAGDYDLGDGFLLRVKLDRNSDFLLHMRRDLGWSAEANAEPSKPPILGRHRFRGPLMAIGESRWVRASAGNVGVGPAVWFEDGRLFHVHVGTSGDDAYRRSNLAFCSVFLTMGGADRVSYEESTSDESVMRDLMIGAGRSRMEIAAQAELREAQLRRTNEQQPDTNETPAKVVGADSRSE